jgi:putative ABC transport system ATP-binding protein
MNIIGGVDRADSGTVQVDGERITDLNDSQLVEYRRESVGFVFQFYNLIPSLTARENVALVTEISPHPMTPEDALRMAGLPDRMDHFPSQLSGGEQQRVAIARAIAKQPDVLLCDEPTGALDYETGKRVLDALAAVNEDLGTTTLVITHNAAIAAMADRVIRLSSGHISEAWANERRATAAELAW